jgi:phosphatidate cytidylyltransferase
VSAGVKEPGGGPPSPAPAGSEHRTRLWVGPVLVLLASGVLLADRHLAPWYPCLLACVLALGLLACVELHGLLGALPRPSLALCLAGVAAVLLANWPAHLPGADPAHAWRDVLGVFAGVVLAGFLAGMAAYPQPGGSVVRVALLAWVVAYLGLLPSFLAQLRWWEEPDRGVTALALTIFVPKFGDIGAYFTGRLLGRHRMAPALSPKKTWEGLAGGLALSALTAVGLNAALPAVLGGAWRAAGFGAVVGLAGVLGDLAESLVKRDGGQKDASQVVPGFGGVLDVVDSVLFAAPVAYWWLRG